MSSTVYYNISLRVYFVTFSQCLYLSVYEYLEQSPSKDPIKCSHHSTKHTTMALHHCRGHELITGAGRNLLRMRVFARGVFYTPWLRRCLQAFWEKKEKQQISIIQRPPSVRGLLSSGWSEKQKESWSEWEGEKKRKQSQVQHMKHGSDWWHSAERDTVAMATAASPDEVTRCARICAPVLDCIVIQR